MILSHMRNGSSPIRILLTGKRSDNKKSYPILYESDSSIYKLFRKSMFRQNCCPNVATDYTKQPNNPVISRAPRGADIIQAPQVKTNPNLFCIRALIPIDSICVLISLCLLGIRTSVIILLSAICYHSSLIIKE